MPEGVFSLNDQTHIMRCNVPQSRADENSYCAIVLDGQPTRVARPLRQSNEPTELRGASLGELPGQAVERRGDLEFGAADGDRTR